MKKSQNFFPLLTLLHSLCPRRWLLTINIHIYTKGEISFESVWDFVKWCSPWGFSCNKRYGLFFSLIHRFKTIHLSLTKIITLCLLNKHQLKDNDSLFFLGTLFQDYFFLFRFSPLALLLLYIPLPIVIYIILTQMHIWDSPNWRGCKRLAVLMRRS